VNLIRKPTDPTVYRDRGGFISGPMVDRPPLRVEVDADTGLVEVVDSAGPLLSMTPDEAREVADQIRTVLATWRPR
jgi:hypothetical protein